MSDHLMQLTATDGTLLYIDPDHVAVIWQDAGKLGSVINTDIQKQFTVRESLEDVAVIRTELLRGRRMAGTHND